MSETKNSSVLFVHFRNFDEVLNIFLKKITLIADEILNSRTQKKKVVREMSKKSRFRGPSNK